MDPNASTFDLALNAIGSGLLFAALALGLALAGLIIKRVYAHYTAERTDGRRLPLWGAVIVALAEVFIDMPYDFHRARMEKVSVYEENLALARYEAMLRHPSNYAARQASLANHPSNFGRGAALPGNAAS